MTTPRPMVNSDYSVMVIRTVTSRDVASLTTREHKRVTLTPGTRGRTL
jgi:hypothetical protein